MAPKGGNTKKEAGRAKKADNEAKKQTAAEEARERKEAAEWDKGAKAAKLDKEAKRKEAAAAKAERERLLAEEEASLPSKPKAAPKAGAAKKKPVTAPRPAGPGTIAAGEGIAPAALEEDVGVTSYSATGIDSALEMMEVVNAKTDKASKGSQAAGMERHPERRFKAAFEAFKEQELPNVRSDHPGLRLNQYEELLYKQFKKSPENPFNQTTVSYDATKEERLEALEKKKKEIEDRLREDKEKMNLNN